LKEGSTLGVLSCSRETDYTEGKIQIHKWRGRSNTEQHPLAWRKLWKKKIKRTQGKRPPQALLNTWGAFQQGKEGESGGRGTSVNWAGEVGQPTEYQKTKHFLVLVRRGRSRKIHHNPRIDGINGKKTWVFGAGSDRHETDVFGQCKRNTAGERSRKITGKVKVISLRKVL